MSVTSHKDRFCHFYHLSHTSSTVPAQPCLFSSTATSSPSCVPHPNTFLLINAFPGRGGMHTIAGECMRREERQGVVLSASCSHKGRGRGAGNEGMKGGKNGLEVCGRCCFAFVSHLFELAINYCPPAESVLAVRVTGKCSTCIYPNHEPFQLIFSPLCCSGEGVRVLSGHGGADWGQPTTSTQH